MNAPEQEGVRQDAEEDAAAREPAPSSPSLRQTLGLIGALLGLLVTTTTCGCGPLMVVLTALVEQGSPSGPVIQQVLAITVLGAGVGLALAVEGWRVWRKRASRPFYPRRPWLLWLALPLLLAAGIVVSLLDLAPAYLLPPINTLTMILLPLLILVAIGRLLGGTGGTQQDVVAGLLSGSSIGTGLAMIVEVVLAILLVAGAVLLGLVPGGVSGMQSLAEQFEDPAFLSDPQALLDLITPGVVLVTLAFVAVVTPLVEEVTKTMGMGLAGLWSRPGPARAFLLGAASGAGFALAENLLNGAIIDVFWGPIVMGRMAATLMHCAASGLMGWGWGELWTSRRPGRLALAFAGAVGIHGLWNGLAVGAAVSGLGILKQADDPAWMLIFAMLILAMATSMLLMTMAMLAGILWASRALGRQEQSA